MIRKNVLLFLISASIILGSCTAVKEYQKVYLHDEEMKLEHRNIENYEADFQSYREGAIGGTNGNAGSGCGCN